MELQTNIKKKTKRKSIFIILGLVFILGSLLILLALFIRNSFSFSHNNQGFYFVLIVSYIFRQWISIIKIQCKK